MKFTMFLWHSCGTYGLCALARLRLWSSGWPVQRLPEIFSIFDLQTEETHDLRVPNTYVKR